MKLIDKIKFMNTLTPNEKILQEFIINNSNDIINLSEEDLISQIYISSSTIYRFTKKLGLKGYDNLRFHLAKESVKETHDSEVNFDFPFTKISNLIEISNNIKKIYSESIELTQASLDYSQLTHGVNLLNKSKNIIFFTSNMNTEIARRFKAQCKELGINISVSNSNYDWKINAANMTKDDVLIINSYSGRSFSQYKQILYDLNNRNVPIIMITSTQCKSLLPYASCVLLMCDKESNSKKINSFSTSISVQYILDLIYICLYQKNYDANYEKQKYIYDTTD